MMFRLVIRELKFCFIRRPWKLLFVILPAVLLVMRERSNIIYARSFQKCFELSAGDLFISLFQGMHTYIPRENSIFNIPYGWMLLMMMITLTVANIGNRDLEASAAVILLQSRSRKRWAASRFISGTIVSVMVFLLLIGICMISARILRGQNSLLPTRYTSEMLGMSINKASSYGIIFLMPWLSVLTLIYIQIMIELIASSVLGYIATITLLFVSCYCSRFYLPGNGAMLIRGALCENAIPTILTMITDCCVMIGSICIGCAGFMKKDIR